MTIATVGAFAIHKLPEAVGVMLFFKIGELFQEYSVGRSRRSIKALLEIRLDYANLKSLGVTKTVMLTGDQASVAAQVSQQLGLDSYEAELLPEGKVKAIEALLSKQGKVAFVGMASTRLQYWPEPTEVIYFWIQSQSRLILNPGAQILDSRQNSLGLTVRDKF